MATKDEMNDFSTSFGEEAPVSAERSDDEVFGITEPEVVVAVVDAGGDGKSEVDPAAAAEAKAVADEANAKASSEAGAESSGSQEAAAQSGKSGDAKPAGGMDVPGDGVPGPGAAREGEKGGETVAAAEEAHAAQADAPHGEMPMGGDMGGEDDEPTDPKDIQRKKSWEGRLKAREAELQRMAEELEAKAASTGQSTQEVAADAIEGAADQAQADGDQGAADSLDAVAEQVASGELTPAEAAKILAEDFGEDFIKLIQSVAVGAVNDKLGAVSKNVEDVISHLTEREGRSHYQAIRDAHPDFVEVGNSQQFQEFVAAKGPDAQAIVDNGSAEDIVALLSEFKGSREVDHGDTPNGEPMPEMPAEGAPAAGGMGMAGGMAMPTPGQDAVAAAEDAVSEEDLDAAEGVRSGGLRLPKEPKKGSDDFEAAWNEF